VAGEGQLYGVVRGVKNGAEHGGGLSGLEELQLVVGPGQDLLGWVIVERV
jgi:hypothetical protein